MAQFIHRFSHIVTIYLPIRGGCMQRLRTLEMAQQIQRRCDRRCKFVLDGFFGFQSRGLRVTNFVDHEQGGGLKGGGLETYERSPQAQVLSGFLVVICSCSWC